MEQARAGDPGARAHVARPPRRRPGIAGPRAGLRHVAYGLLALGFAVVDQWSFLARSPKGLLRSALVAEGVVRGEPMWRVYQSRVLGPLLLHGLTAFTPLSAAYAYFSLIMLFAAGLAVLLLTSQLQDRARPPVRSFLIYQLTVLLLLPGLWLYPWDLVSLVLFSVFNFLVLQGARWVAFVWLYAVALLNHELGLFIAAWIALSPLVRVTSAQTRERGPRSEWTQALTGAGLTTLGLVVVETLRNVLLVHETQGPQALPAEVVYGRSFHFTLEQNWSTLRSVLTLTAPDAAAWFVPLFLAAVVAIATRLAQTDWARLAAYSAVTVGMVVALLCFGLIFETRVLLPLVPFVAMNAWAALARPVRKT